MCAYETQRKLVTQLGWNPGRMDLYSDPRILTRFPHLAALKDVFRHARPRPMVPFYNQLSMIGQRHINAVLADDNTPEQALTHAQEEIDALLARYSAGVLPTPGRHGFEGSGFGFERDRLRVHAPEIRAAPRTQSLRN